MVDFSTNLARWMTNLPEKLRNIPITNLAIPGSHDSTTYAITRKSQIAPDARRPIQFFKFLEPLLAPFILKWSQTQSADITKQLECGIRYFDFRIATKINSDGFYFVHNLYSENVTAAFTQIKKFLEYNQDEVVILDCQHFFNMDDNDHVRLIAILKSFFYAMLVPYRSSFEAVTLDNITRNLQYQVLVVYRADAAINEELLWPPVSCPTPWPDTVSIPHLVKFLSEELTTRDSSVCFVSQCVLTPTVWYVCRNPFGSLRSTCVTPLEKDKYSWIKRQKPGLGGVNIVISDFIDDDNYHFSKEVVALNKNLLDFA